MYVWFCLFGVFLSTQELFIHMEMSLLSLRGCQLWSILRSKGSLCGHTYCYKGYLFYIGHLRGPVTLRNTVAKGLPAKVSLFVLSLLGFEHSTLLMRGVLSKRVRHRTGLNYSYFSWQIYIIIVWFCKAVFPFSS